MISLLRPLASALGISIQQLMTQTDNRLTDPMSKFHITDGYIRPFGKNPAGNPCEGHRYPAGTGKAVSG